MPFTFEKTHLDGVQIITPKKLWDGRWRFSEFYKYSDFATAWIKDIFLQWNHSMSNAWVIRGLHLQTKNPQAKLIRVIKWNILDVLLDARPQSITFGKRGVFELDEKTKKQLYIPAGYAHWFVALENGTEFEYLCDKEYDPGNELSINYKDPALGINLEERAKVYWIDNFTVSEKDQKGITFEEYKRLMAA